MAKEVKFSKKDKNPEGGLSAAGRRKAKKAGMNLKPPVSSEEAKKSPKKAARRKSFCKQMGGDEKEAHFHKNSKRP